MADAERRRWGPPVSVLVAVIAATALAAAVLEYDQDTRCDTRVSSWLFFGVAVLVTLTPVLVAWRVRWNLWVALLLSVTSAVVLGLLFNVGRSYDCFTGPLVG